MVRLVAVIAGLGLLGAACGSGESDAAPSDASGSVLDGVIEVEVADRVVHVLGEVDYTTSPPAGGDHFGGWQNCGFYSVPLTDEVAVHSLEHGAVWVTYQPGLDQATLSSISLETVSQSHLLASPYAGQQSPLVLTAWERQLPVDSWEDPAVAAFLDQYLGRRSPTAPEPGVSCSGAVGEPPSDAMANYENLANAMAQSG